MARAEQQVVRCGQTRAAPQDDAIFETRSKRLSGKIAVRNGIGPNFVVHGNSLDPEEKLFGFRFEYRDRVVSTRLSGSGYRRTRPEWR